ncbi:MAG: uridine kinase [Candidatus Marinimicrobia bacterium]|jgi:uridine kinase|nr:uridine kinase [Candidatus Neomarinimicrobiota bacterium]MBT3675195.1 uridine kinase [Candidatus Neomarinimicrobiota bacterium]MBT3763569.1 uridine kinase [Candidatus Neomarinimicrobiota bacterium]MBT4069560.1 uridine kinase [Candidatus Neomarinimicrobiota bacterium]MBT4271328.1 uridine kinase [Candidatus Neomarinimicrobiota bacterium]
MSISPILIGISGGTGSGKTSIAKSLLEEYGEGEVVVVEQDAYYRNISNLPLEERHKQNFDHPDAIDIELFNQQLISLIKGQSIKMPIYDFSTHSRNDETRNVDTHHVIVVEGILALHYLSLRELMDIKIFVDTPDDIRFIRRLSRDVEERGRTVNSVIEQYLKTVRPMHQQFVEPSKYYSDIIIPEGGQNKVAIDLLRTKINAILS